MRRQPQGIVLIVSLMVLTGLTALVSVGLLRAVSERAVAARFVTNLQAFHAAEAGMDALIYENRQAGWGFRTHQNETTKVTTSPTPTLAGATINAAGDYVLPLIGVQTATVRVFPDTTNPTLTRIRSTGLSNPSQEQVAALFQSVGLLDHVFLQPGPAKIGQGQRVTILGGPGRIMIDGDLRVDSGHYSSDPNFKKLTIESDFINVNGAIRRSIDNNNAPIVFRKPIKNTEKVVVKYFDAAKTKPFVSTDYPPDYQSWLTAGSDFSGLIKEKLTGAKSLAALMPQLPSIDTFVSQFKDKATLTIEDDSDVPCGAARDVTFTNAQTLKLVEAVEINVRQLEDCDASDKPKVLYSTVPLRLVNGDKLDAGLTVASVEAIYVKGDFNKNDSRPVSVVSANRVYHLSSSYRDYTKFIKPDKVYDYAGKLINTTFPTLADAIEVFGKNPSNEEPTQAAYLAFKNNYDAQTLPPWTMWRPEYMANVTVQHLAIVSPIGKHPAGHKEAGTVMLKGHNMAINYIVMEDGDGDQSQGYNPKPRARMWRPILRRIGAFINLPDDDPNTVCVNPPSCTQTTPQDYRAVRSDKKFLSNNHALTGLISEMIYDSKLPQNLPPAFTKTGGGSGTQVLWER